MVTNIIGILVLVVLVLLFAWLAARAIRSRNGVIKWLGTPLSGLLALVLAVITVVAAIGLVRMSNSPYVYTYNIAGLPNTGSQQQAIARGQKLALICSGCHSTNPGQLPLDGSKDNFAAGGPPVGTLYAPNLTPAGPLKDWTDAQIARAIREGVDKDGRPLIIMPSQAFHSMSDEDVLAIIAYLRSQPPVKRDLPPNQLNLLAAAFLGTGQFPTSAQPPITQPIHTPPAGTKEDGIYLVNITGCRECHGENLAGGSPGGGPVGPNLTTLVPNWTQEQFVKTIQTGVDPTGHQLNPDAMPWKEISQAYSDQELADIYQYLHGLQPVTK